MNADDKRRANLAHGKGFTEKPRIYVGCIPCGQSRYVADITHANIWIETHWKRCKRSSRLSDGTYTLTDALRVPGKGSPRNNRSRASGTPENVENA